MAILVTGGCGFIGSNFVRRWLEMNDELLINVDKMTYAADITLNPEFQNNESYLWRKGSIEDMGLMAELLMVHRPRAIVNFAAESHVDNSIANAFPFMKTNIMGTFNLLECVRQCDPNIKFIHVSTDEVFGSLGKDDLPFDESTAYDPRSPYSASKASSDHLVRAYHHTHGLNTMITNCSNNYGPYQNPEKLIPVIIRKALAGERIPIYGDGTNVRDWIYVMDHVEALMDVLDMGEAGETYCVGGGNEYSNLRIAYEILDILEIGKDLIEFVEDRKGHDFRYAINSEKIYIHLGWKPRTDFMDGLYKTVEWYKQNTSWVSKCLERSESS